MWLTGLLAVIQLLPVLVETIGVLTKQVEGDGIAGGGAAKKEAVLGLVKVGVDAANKFDPEGELMSEVEKDAVLGVAGEAVDLMVGLYNTVGTFTHSERQEA